MFRSHIVVLAFLPLVAACNMENPLARPSVEPEPPVARTTEEILAEVRPVIQHYKTVAANPGGGVDEETRMTVMNGLRDLKVKYGDTEAGREAFRIAAEDLANVARQAADAERWRLTQACVDAYELLGLESKFLQRIDTRAEQHLAKPTVIVRGFIDDPEKGDVYVFLDLIDRRTKKIERTVAREGEEFNNLRLQKIVGKNKTVIFEYLPIPGLTFEVEGV